MRASPAAATMADTAAAAPFRSTAQLALRHRVLRAFYGVGAAAALLALLASLLPADARPLRLRLVTMLGYGLLSLGCLAAARLPPTRADRALPLVALAMLVVIGLMATLNGWGVAAPGTLFMPPLVGMVCAVAGRPVARLVSASALLVVLAMALAGGPLWPAPAAPGDAVPPMLRLLMLMAAIVATAAGGRALAAMLARHLAVAAGRERRFQALLAIAAAAYWETDSQLRLRQVSWRNPQGDFLPLPGVVGQMLWELDALEVDAEALDALQADMESRATLTDLPFAWRDAGGEARHFLASAQPRLDADGRLLGYWGVAREVTLERRASSALLLTERRYHELFLGLPTPLLLHRDGHIIDANPAAAALLGYPSAAAMLGRDLLARHFTEPDRSLAQARMAQLCARSDGQAAMTSAGTRAPASYRLLSNRGDTLHVRAFLTRADNESPPALMSMLVDETATMLAAQSQLRTEALFAQVLATSPDVITLTDLHSGHYLMVNDSFCRVTGYRVDEVVGRSALELGIWRKEDDRIGLLDLLGQHGSVDDVSVDFVAKHGAVVPLLVSASRFERDGRQLLVLNARDVTEAARLRIEREAILANASVGIAFTRERQFVMVNPQFERIYGWPPGALVGRSGRVVWASDAAYESLGAVIGPALRLGEAVEIEREGQRQDGSRFLVRLRAKALDPLHPGEHGTIWIAEDVTQARQDAAALATARDAAEAASRAKSAFLANTSHEIRTPLNGLLGLARLAREPGVPAQRQREYLDQIADSAQTLSAIISDILDLSKIEAGKLDVMAAPFDLHELLQGLQQAYAALAAGHGLDFALELDPTLPTRVRGDALRTRQILGNFLNNALKFTARGSVRLVVQWRPGGLVRFEVHDTGPGIDADTQRRLFQPFTQADESITRRHGGTGLGLSICQQLAGLMGGLVGLRSVPGQGSCFFAELPLPAEPASTPASAEVMLDAEVLRGARVLLVEDNSVNMLIGVALLEQWQVQVSQASDGAQALAAVAAAQAAGLPFQLVLMDVQMPDISGYEVTIALRQQHSAQRLPVIALTAAALLSERRQALASGMTDFVSKPIEPKRLREALLRALAQRNSASAKA